MSCPRVVKRNRGSGYEKVEAPVNNSLSNDLATKLAERAVQDSKIASAFQVVAAPVSNNNIIVNHNNDGKR